jgi:hypothetical protein
MMTDFMRWSPLDELWMLGDQLERQVSQWSRPVPGTRVMPSASVVSSAGRSTMTAVLCTSRKRSNSARNGR